MATTRDDEYQLGELLGRGGMGQVHLARHRSGRVVAVKRVRNTLAMDRLVRERLEDETRLLRAVSHPNVVRALDGGTDADGQPYLVMDRAFGTPLNQLIRERGPVSREQVAVIAAQLFGGIAAIHDAHIVHQDLKSHNILVDDVNIVTIIDFGLARTLEQAANPNGLVAGTPAYMAPEMIAGGEASVVADIYAIATILYEMLTGTTPFSGHISTILTRQLSESVEPPSRRAPHCGISPALDAAVLRGLDPSPLERYQSVRGLAMAFLGALEGRSPGEPVLASGSGTWRETVDVRYPTASLRPAVPVRLNDQAEAMISDVLGRVQPLIDRHCLVPAVEMLEAALSELGPSAGGGVTSYAGAWRLETVLAALYDALGKQERAQRTARVAFRHALQTGCPRAEVRARVTVERLVTRPRRFGRGSLPAR